MQGSTNNATCFLGPHRRYDPFTKSFFSLVPGQGHFGPDAMPGVSLPPSIYANFCRSFLNLVLALVAGRPVAPWGGGVDGVGSPVARVARARPARADGLLEEIDLRRARDPPAILRVERVMIDFAVSGYLGGRSGLAAPALRLERRGESSPYAWGVCGVGVVMSSEFSMRSSFERTRADRERLHRTLDFIRRHTGLPADTDVMTTVVRASRVLDLPWNEELDHSVDAVRWRITVLHMKLSCISSVSSGADGADGAAAARPRA